MCIRHEKLLLMILGPSQHSGPFEDPPASPETCLVTGARSLEPLKKKRNPGSQGMENVGIPNLSPEGSLEPCQGSTVGRMDANLRNLGPSRCASARKAGRGALG